MSMRALNLKALQQIRFLGLNDPTIATKDWAIRIMINVVDMEEKQEAAMQLLNLLFNPEAMVAKAEVASLIKTILGREEESAATTGQTGEEEKKD